MSGGWSHAGGDADAFSLKGERYLSNAIVEWRIFREKQTAALIPTGMPDMFTDKRSKKLILVAHCLLNQNSISDGTAGFPSQFREIVELLMDHQVGIIQLPCPELICLGLDRQAPDGATRELLSENTRIRGLLETEHRLETLRAKAGEVAAQVEEYGRYGFEVLGLIGIDRSPSCGVETTTKDASEVAGKGIFVAALEEKLRDHGIVLTMIGVKTSRVLESLDKARKFLVGGRGRSFVD